MIDFSLKKTVTRAHPKGGILNFCLTEDSCHAVTCGQDRTLALWNPWRGLRIKTYTNGHHGPVVDCAISTNKSSMLSVGQQDTYGLMWDISTGRIIRRVGTHDLGLTSCLLVGQDTIAVQASSDKSATFWDLRDRQSRRPLQVLSDAYDTVTSLAQYNEHILLTASLDGFVRRYDLRAGMLTCDFIHHPVTHLEQVHSSDAQCVAAVSLGGVITLVDLSVSDRARNASLNYFSGFVNDSGAVRCAVDLEDSHVISASEDGCVYIWDIGGKDPNSPERVVRDAHDGSVVNGVCVLRDNDATRRKVGMKREGFLRAEAQDEVAMDNSTIFTYGQDGSFRVWSLL
eukprot:Protomagalhaensia_wolfi_Nauph_80__386@NODE_1212_length_1656_cov_18_366729_g932_i0_p1_GENE_NODE_1212_length_1656_cov_18_366729_g932_i0NODE_1212_length_1656_cov_18_366729_g932_i0_p1_ORF_typecomplete_len342_score38_69WD40/PF00400_32/0_38WD40/PF00400_32/0_091WD40/PF00400_32/8_1WD40/PF00400_32/0_031WD40/PF00400_32/2_3ANAPC4_WD40/PF12894_7/4_4e05ANAPC4_WD40/PF12894_7/0_031ANAPC4_WD40/PF12894_7/2_8ANAPC4_WD40/PF12894_7/8_8e02WD40_like/PF17005_5/4_6WD40_like/PF17005_5/0_25WD40_like/PF17005_5/0_00027WD40